MITLEVTMKKSLLAASIALSVMALAENTAFAAHSDIRDQVIETIGDESPVVAAQNGDTLTVTNVDLISSGLHSVGVLADGAGSLVTYQGGTINTSGRTSHALSAHNGAHIKADNLTIHTTGTLGRGIQAETGSLVELSNSSIQVDGGVDGNTTAGAAASGGAGIILNNTSVLATGQGSVGIMTIDASSIEMNGGSVTTTNTVSDAVMAMAGGGSILLNDVAVSTAGAYSRGVVVGGADSVVGVQGGSITTSGGNAEAVRAGSGGKVYLAGTQVQTLGAQSIGLQTVFGGLIDATGVNLTTAGDRSAGVSSEGVGSLVNFSNGTISTAGLIAEGAKAQAGGAVNLSNVAVSTSGAFSRALVADGNGSSVVADHVVIDTSGGQSYGLLAFGVGSQVTFTNGKITTRGAEAHAVAAYNGGDIVIANSEIDSSGHAMVSTAATGTHNRFEVSGSQLTNKTGSAISVSGDGSHEFVINNSLIDGQSGVLFDLSPMTPGVPNLGSSTLVANGSVLKGDINAASDPDFVADFSLQNATHWTGAGQGINQLDLRGASVWQMTGNSSIQSLNLQDGRVNFDHADGLFKTLTTDKLAGTGGFQMNTNLATLEGDLLVVTAAGGATGNHTLFIEDSGLSPKNADDVLRVVDTNGGDAKFGLYGGHVDAGAFRYTLGKDGDDWFLSNTGSANPGPGDLSKGANAAIAAHTAGAAMWTSQMDALVKRLGELRMGKDEGGVWTRAIGKQFDVSEKSSRAYQQNISGVEVGADKAIQLNGGKVYVGGMVGTAKSDLNFGEGASGEIDSKMVGAYATYLDDSGVYVDSVIKYNRLNNEIKTPTNLGNSVKASYDTNGLGASVEVGKHIALDQGWFVEPQVALSVSRTQGASYTASNGLKVKTDDLDSLQSRVGSLFGRDIQLDNGMQVQPYVKASLITEHAGNSKVNVNGSRLDAELQGNRVELGFGGIAKVTQNSKVSLDAEYAKGSSIEQPWGVTLGYRYAW